MYSVMPAARENSAAVMTILLDPSMKDVLKCMNQAVKTDLLISAVVKLSPSVVTVSSKTENNDKT